MIPEGVNLMRFRKAMMACLTAVAALSLTACSSNQQSRDKHQLNWMEAGEITTMDPSKASDYASLDQLNNTYSGLYRLGKNAHPDKELAVKTVKSKNGKTWTFTLRKNSKWSNGQPVTAQDFVYSWRRTVNPETSAQYSYLFSGIKNADAITAGKMPATSLGIKALSKYKLQVQLEKKIPYFKLLLAFPVFAPQNKAAVQKYGSKYGTASKYQVYNGPFVQKGWTGSNMIWNLDKNKHYWDKKAVRLHRIHFSVSKTASTDYNLYQTGKLDGASLSKQGSQQLKDNPGFTVRPIASTQFLVLNQAKVPALRNAKIRQALSLAVNRKQLANVLGTAMTPAYTMTPEKMTKVDGKDYTDLVKNKQTLAATAYNPKKAAKLFKEGLAELGYSRLKLNLITFDTDGGKDAGESLQSQLDSNLPGLSVSVQQIPLKSALNRGETGNFELLLDDWIADFADPISFLDLPTTNNSNNYGHWTNVRYNQLITASKNTNSDNKRFQYLAKAEQVLLQDEGMIPLFHSSAAWIVRPSVKDIVYNSAGAAYDFKYTYIK
jgi:oligopeptide transport system substrate-binding protein